MCIRDSDKRGADRTEKFGRLLGEVLVEGTDGAVVSLNDLLLEKGMALPVDAGGSTIRAVGRPADQAQAAPPAIRCPYCGEVRAVEQANGLVAQCTNCLDGAFSLARGAA